MVATGHADITIYYDSLIEINERQQIIDIAKKSIRHEEKKKYFHMVCRDNGDMYLKDFEIKSHEVELDSHYNDDFLEIDSLIKNSLNDKSKNCIILLHGLYGTGKTYYIRHLINTINRKFIYFPLYMIDAISSPEFLPFITEHPHSVLILEDCENLLMHREKGNMNNNALSNLLNLGDGLLSDALSVNVICTFNANVAKIDEALLRKGRMLARYEFRELSKEKTIELTQKLGKQMIDPKPMTIADIYNLENVDFQDKTQAKIGF
jgi:SpoVK/Ycf46/Vps4 family AAA+-type ATPase